MSNRVDVNGRPDARSSSAVLQEPPPADWRRALATAKVQRDAEADALTMAQALPKPAPGIPDNNVHPLFPKKPHLRVVPGQGVPRQPPGAGSQPVTPRLPPATGVQSSIVDGSGLQPGGYALTPPSMLILNSVPADRAGMANALIHSAVQAMHKGSSDHGYGVAVELAGAVVTLRYQPATGMLTQQVEGAGTEPRDYMTLAHFARELRINDAAAARQQGNQELAIALENGGIWPAARDTWVHPDRQPRTESLETAPEPPSTDPANPNPANPARVPGASTAENNTLPGVTASNGRHASQGSGPAEEARPSDSPQADEPVPPAARFDKADFPSVTEAVRYLEAYNIGLDPRLGMGSDRLAANRRGMPLPMEKHTPQELLTILNAITPSIERIEAAWPGLLAGMRIHVWQVPQTSSELTHFGQSSRRTVSFAAEALITSPESAYVDANVPADSRTRAAIEATFLHEVGHFITNKTSPVMRTLLETGNVPIGIIHTGEDHPELPGVYSSWNGFTQQHGITDRDVQTAGIGLLSINGGDDFVVVTRSIGDMAQIGGTLSEYPVSSAARDPATEAIAELLAHYLRPEGPRYDLDAGLPRPWATSPGATGLRNTAGGLSLLVWLTLLDAQQAGLAPDIDVFVHSPDLPSLNVLYGLPYRH